MKRKLLERFALYDLIEDEAGATSVVIHDGVTTLVEYPMMPRLFVPDDRVTQVYIPNSLESVLVAFLYYFPKCRTIRERKDSPKREGWRFEYGVFHSAEHPVEVPPNIFDNGDGTYTLDIPEGVYTTDEDNYLSGRFSVYDQITTMRIPASMQKFEESVGWRFHALKTIHVHPDNPYFIAEDGVLFSADKKRIVKYPRDKEGDTYRIDDAVEIIGAGCFSGLNYLQNIYIGKGVRKIENCALGSDLCFCPEKVYIPPTVTELEGEIFDAGADDGGMYYPIEIVGGAKGSAIEEYCNSRDIKFVEIAEDRVDEFYAATVDELCQLAEEQARLETEFWVDECHKGYRMHFADGTLEVMVSDGVTLDQVTVSDTRSCIGKHRREKVKALIIGAGITAIEDLAFDDYKELESIAIGPHVRSIAPNAFSGQNETISNGCTKVNTITVDAQNQWYKAIDNVLYTADMATLVKYAPNKPELSYQVDARVRHIGAYAFEYAENLQSLKVGEGCVSIGEMAFLNTAYNLRHIYFAASVTQWPEDVMPFVAIYGFDRPWYNDKQVIAGPRNSVAQQYCDEKGVHFYPMEETEIADFLAVPLVDEDNDPYLAECQKKMIVDEYGTLLQVGEVGEELVFPEGVETTRYRINLSPCKKVSIPATLTSFWTAGLDGPANNLAEFVVAADNPRYMAIEGHLCDRDGRLLTYAPATTAPGQLPEGITAIDSHAFRLLGNPIPKLCIPASVTEIPILPFYEVQVHPDNKVYRALDGNLVSADGKTLICAKVSQGDYQVPDGVVAIGKEALRSVKGRRIIPAGVTQIDGPPGIYYNSVVRVVKGSYGERYMKNWCVRRFAVEVELLCPDGSIEKLEVNEDFEIDANIDCGDLNFKTPIAKACCPPLMSDDNLPF